MTIGEYLKKVLYEKNISTANLCDMIGIKNRSIIYRLFNDYHSETKTKAMVENIMSVVNFTAEEKNRINELMKRKKVSRFLRETRKILSDIYTCDAMRTLSPISTKRNDAI